MFVLPLLIVTGFSVNCIQLKGINNFISIFNGIYKIAIIHHETNSIKLEIVNLEDDDEDYDDDEDDDDEDDDDEDDDDEDDDDEDYDDEDYDDDRDFNRKNREYLAHFLHDFKFDERYLVQSNSTLFLDIGIMIQANISDGLNDIGVDYIEYFGRMMIDMQQIFWWYRIQLSVISIELTEFSITGQDSSDNFQTEIKNAYINRKAQNTDFTLFFYDLYKNLRYIDRDNFFCRNNSMYMIYLPQEMYYSTRLLVEIVVEDLFDNMLSYLINENYEEMCKCPYKFDKMCFSLRHRVRFPRPHWPPKIQVDCDIEYLLKLFFKSHCLFEKHKEPNIFASCGNGVLDIGEECDCGHAFQCNHTGQEECCYYDTCRFKDRSFQCSNGECCDHCKFAKSKICRKAFGECDLDEVCTGNSSECPLDIIYENYALCNNKEGFCWNGMCSNHHSMCTYIYDEDDISFNQDCYDNILGNIKSLCNQKIVPQNISSLCNANDICSYFICSTPYELDGDYLINIKMSDVYCFLPTNLYVTGALAYAPNYVKCSKKSDHFCHNSKCTSDKNKLKNCHNNICYSINNNLTYPMTKNIPLDSHGFQYMNLGIYPYVKDKIFIPIIIYVLPIGIYIGISSAIIAAVLIIGLILCILKRRKKILPPSNNP